MKVPVPGFNEETLKKYPPLGAFVAELGETPLLEVETPTGCGSVFAKCEWHNPGGSIKDRTAAAMLWDFLGRHEGSLQGKTILEYSGGALSIPLAKLCNQLGLRCVLVLLESTAASVIETITDFGAEVILTKKHLGFWGVMEKALTLAEENPEWDFFYQHRNSANIRMHRYGTAREILEQLPDVRVDAWVAAVGTGGSLIGVYQGLCEANPNLELHPVSPAELPYGSLMAPHGQPKFSGSGGLGNGRKQPFVEPFEDRITHHHCYYLAQARAEMVAFYERSGVKIGSSAAANLLAATRVATQLGPDSLVATIFPNAGFIEEWQAVDSERLK